MRMHSRLGPGLLESAYERCERHGFDRHAITWARQVDLPLDYGGTLIDCGCRADIIVDHAVILELKSVEQLLPLHEAQLLTYLRLSRCRFGLLFNSKTLSLKDGIRRRILSDHNPISDDRCRYCSATSAALAGRIIRIASGTVTTGHNTACTQSGGSKRNSTQNASPTTMAPSTQDHADGGAVAGIILRAGRARRPRRCRAPQADCGTGDPCRSEGSGSAALPAGSRAARCATDRGVSARQPPGWRPTSRCRRTGTARPRRRNASTRQRPRSRNAAPGVNWSARARNQQTIRKQVPTMTWKPWKPVARKKTDG